MQRARYPSQASQAASASARSRVNTQSDMSQQSRVAPSTFTSISSFSRGDFFAPASPPPSPPTSPISSTGNSSGERSRKSSLKTLLKRPSRSVMPTVNDPAATNHALRKMKSDPRISSGQRVKHVPVPPLPYAPQYRSKIPESLFPSAPDVVEAEHVVFSPSRGGNPATPCCADGRYFAREVPPASTGIFVHTEVHTSYDSAPAPAHRQSSRQQFPAHVAAPMVTQPTAYPTARLGAPAHLFHGQATPGAAPQQVDPRFINSSRAHSRY